MTASPSPGRSRSSGSSGDFLGIAPSAGTGRVGWHPVLLAWGPFRRERRIWFFFSVGLRDQGWIAAKDFFGRVAEWLKAHDWKSCGLTPAWVRIPPRPLPGEARHRRGWVSNPGLRLRCYASSPRRRTRFAGPRLRIPRGRVAVRVPGGGCHRTVRASSPGLRLRCYASSPRRRTRFAGPRLRIPRGRVGGEGARRGLPSDGVGVEFGVEALRCYASWPRRRTRFAGPRLRIPRGWVAAKRWSAAKSVRWGTFLPEGGGPSHCPDRRLEGGTHNSGRGSVR